MISDQCEIPKNQATTDEIKEILTNYKTIAVVGASPKDDRPSFGVSGYLKDNGFKIIPVNPVAKQIHGEKCYSDLRSIPDKVDIVDVFRKPEFVPDIAKIAVEIGAKVLWLQEGVISNEAAEIATKAGLKVIQNKCILKEHMKLS